MHIAASDPKFVRKEDVTPEDYAREKDYISPRPSPAVSLKDCRKDGCWHDGKVLRRVCLLEQPFIKDQTISISQLIAAKVGKLGENIAVRRFARFKVGDATATSLSSAPSPTARA